MNLGQVSLGVRPDRRGLAPAQIALSVCVLLALICLAASLLVAQPLALRPPTPATLLPLLGGLLGLAAGVLGLHANQGRPAAPPRPAFAPPVGHAADLLDDLRRLLAEERRETAAMREQCAATGNEALLVGARLTGAALEAEQRLAASVGLAEQALQNPGGALARSAAATRRVERAIGELSDLIKAGPDAALADAHPPSADEMLAPLIAELASLAARLEAASPGLDRVEAVGLRLGRVTENLPAAIEKLVAAVPAALARMASEAAVEGGRKGTEAVLF